MTALKGKDIDKFLNQPDLKTGLIVVYGPDNGLVSENAAKLAKFYSGNPPDPDSIINLQMSEIEADPQRLAIESRMPSLFSDGKVIRVRYATSKLAPTLAELLEENVDAIFVVETGDVKPTDALRKLAEARRDARALPCYADNGQAIDALIRSSFAQANIQTETDLIPMLRDMLGNDRQITRREIEKLVLFAGDGGTLTREDVITLCGDNAALAIDAVLDAVATGHAKKFDDNMIRALAAGTDMQRILIMSLQHFARLRAMRAEMDLGASAGDVINRSRPPVHFSRKASMEQQLRLWNDGALSRACARISQAIGDSRKNSTLSQSIARQALMSVTIQASRR